MSDENSYTWRRNIPFELVPADAINQLREKKFTYEEYLLQTSMMNMTGVYWNLALIDSEGRLVFFIWGTFEPLEKMLHVLRATLHRDKFKYNNSWFLESAIDQLKFLARDVRAERIYWLTDKFKAFSKKLDGLAYISNTRVMEVY